MKTTTIIFDLGAVLIDWNPRHLYKKIFKTESEMEWFLANVCTGEWNEEQDAGRSFQEATHLLISAYPQFESEIKAFWLRWEEMLAGPLEGTVKLFSELRKLKRYNIYALTNWSAETFPLARKKFDFLAWFDGIVISGEEKTRKPFREFYEILLTRYRINPKEALFIDDNLRNLEGAKTLDIDGIHFTSPVQLRQELTDRRLMG